MAPKSSSLAIALSDNDGKPVRQRVVDALRAAILDLRIQPGQRLIERELVERFSVSRTTVREALRDLTSEGLITIVPQRGAMVTVPSVDEASDLFQARAALEGLLVKLFTERAAKSQTIRLEAAIEAYAEAAVTHADDPALLLKAKDDVIEVIAAGAASPAVEEIAAALRGRVRLLRLKAISMDHDTRVSELRDILAAVRSGAGDRAASAYADHILSSKVRAFTVLRGAAD